MSNVWKGICVALLIVIQGCKSTVNFTPSNGSPPNIKQCQSHQVFVQHSTDLDIDIRTQDGQCIISVNGATKADGGMDCEEQNGIIYIPSTVQVNTVINNGVCTFLVD